LHIEKGKEVYFVRGDLIFQKWTNFLLFLLIFLDRLFWDQLFYPKYFSILYHLLFVLLITLLHLSPEVLVIHWLLLDQVQDIRDW